MTHFWGVDSFSPASHMVGVPAAHLRAGERAGLRETLFDYVTRRAGRAPDFWGRYLNNGLRSALQPGEAAFIFAQGEGRCRIALVYNGIRGEPAGAAAGRAGGEAAAREAVALAIAQGVPTYVRIYLDLEGWRVEPEFLEGWWDGMSASSYAGAGGIYGRGAEVVPRPRSHMPDLSRRPHSSGWAARVPAAEDRAAARAFPGLISDIAAGRSTRPQSRYIWSNIPRRFDQNRDTPAGTQIIPDSFGAVGPVGAMLNRTVLWQYRFGAFWAEGTTRGMVDLDLALEAGYAEMWRA